MKHQIISVAAWLIYFCSLTPGAWGDEYQTVAVFSEAPVYFLGSDNQRDISNRVSLPPEGSYAAVTLTLTLDCPKGGQCDRWDRVGFIGARDQQGRKIELVRFATPYGQGGTWTQDITDYLPLLRDEVTFDAFIDTWVGPGHGSGDGWLLSVDLTFVPGTLAQKPRRVIPVMNFDHVVYGDPKRPAIREMNVDMDQPHSHAKLITKITGHGQGNQDNCAEFCGKRHHLTINGQDLSRFIWRDNCATSVDQNQRGNYFHSRAGWCPGDIAAPWTEALGELPVQSDPLEITYRVQDYVNSCRPDSDQCSHCVLGTGCNYDGGRHTEPVYKVSAHIILY